MAGVKARSRGIMEGFFGLPTRGGKLAVLNVLLWPLLIWGPWGEGGTAQIVLFWVAAVPIGWLFVLPMFGMNNQSPDAGVWLVVACIGVGLNSFLWGYWLSALFELVDDWRRTGRSERGFDPLIRTAELSDDVPREISEK